MDYEEWKRKNWDEAHKTSNVSALTGTGLDGHLATLQATDLFDKNSTVLCIGVGLGDWVRDFSEKVEQIWALDVSEIAKVRMPLGAVFTTDPRDLPSDTFDLALSLWVAPHMSDHDLQVQLTEVIRALKPTGTFAIHYKEPLYPDNLLDNREGADDEHLRAREAMMIRRRAHFFNMVTWAGGHVDKIAIEYPSNFYEIVEASAHIHKGDGS